MRRLLFLGLLMASTSHAQAVDWWSVDKGVSVELQDRDLDVWAAELADAEATRDPVELVRRFDIFVRAGLPREAQHAFRTLAQVDPKAQQANDMAMFLLERESWELARDLLETFPHAHPGWVYVMVGEWRVDPELVDSWLAARVTADPSEDFWLLERVRFRKDQGTEEPLVSYLAEEVRREPADVGAALRYLTVVRRTDVDRYDPAWLAEVVRPASAHAAWRFGEELARNRPEAAISVLRDALKRPWTAEDQAEMDRVMRLTTSMMIIEKVSWEQTYRDGVRGTLLEALKRAGHVDEAQALLEDLTERIGGVPLGLSQLAGQIQGQSGARFVQGKILEQQEASEDDASYWTERAGYFTGRSEHAQAVFAYERAVALADEREISQISRSYARYLAKHDSVERAVNLLLGYLAQTDPAGDYAEQLVHGLLSHERDDTGLLVSDDPVLWAFLGAQTPWDYAEERLLWRLASNGAVGAERDAVWQRAEGLCDDASRLRVLGWVMTRTQEHLRAVPHLRRALELSEGDPRLRAAFTLFEAHLELGNWAEAEALWPLTRSNLTPREQPVWLGKVALIAAKAGEPDAAMRQWKQRANLDRGDLRGLKELAAAADMKARLLVFYTDLAKKHPENQALGDALEMLR